MNTGHIGLISIEVVDANHIKILGWCENDAYLYVFNKFFDGIKYQFLPFDPDAEMLDMSLIQEADPGKVRLGLSDDETNERTEENTSNLDRIKPKRGPKTPPDDVKLAALKDWDAYDKHDMTLQEWLIKRFGVNENNTPNVLDYTFHSWRRTLREKGLYN